MLVSIAAKIYSAIERKKKEREKYREVVYERKIAKERSQDECLQKETCVQLIMVLVLYYFTCD